MGAMLDSGPGNLTVLRIRGLLKKKLD
ncbi:MAG: hypothetical protein H6Q52_2145, partial [Deltaproteobacteria bacterium]|nr:hypothetical protein [Deltaproteobacteria bacterium]